MLVELLQPAGPELARRWLAALLLAPREEREGLVRAVEGKVAQLFGTKSPLDRSPAEDREFTVINPPVRKDGYVEQIETTYAQPNTDGLSHEDAPAQDKAQDKAQGQQTRPRRRAR